jgi:hypothetical protein
MYGRDFFLLSNDDNKVIPFGVFGTMIFLIYQGQKVCIPSSGLV